MGGRNREIVLVALMLVLLGGAAAWCYGWMGEQRRSSQAAATDLAECRSHAIAIRSLRSSGGGGLPQAGGQIELGKRVEAALAAAGIDSNCLSGVFSQQARPVDNSPYLVQPTTLLLRGVSLGELATLLYHLTDGSGLSVRDLRISIPRGDAAQIAWDAEATVTCLVSAPPTRSRRQHGNE